MFWGIERDPAKDCIENSTGAGDMPVFNCENLPIGSRLLYPSSPNKLTTIRCLLVLHGLLDQTNKFMYAD